MSIPDGPNQSLADLAELLRAGALTDEEFTAARAAVLGHTPEVGPPPRAREIPTQRMPEHPGYRPPRAPTSDVQSFDAPPAPRGQPRPSEQPGPDRRNTWLIVAGIAVLALAVGAVALVLALQPHTPSATPVVDLTPPQASTPYQTTPPFDTTGTDTLTTPPSTPRSTAPPTTVGAVDIGAVVTNPQAFVVGQTLDTYFSGINQHNYDQTLSVLDPAIVNQADPSQVSRFEQGLSTTTDSNVTVTAIRADPTAPSGIAADVTMHSTQAPNLGPDGQTCTNWALTYLFSGTPDSGLRIYKTHGTHTAC